MKFQKNDNVDEFKVLLPLKNNGMIETYRVRGNDGLLYALNARLPDFPVYMQDLVVTMLCTDM